MNAGHKSFYACAVDWRHEMGETYTRLYKTEEDLRKATPCVDQCGIVRIDCTAVWIQPENFPDGAA